MYGNQNFSQRTLYDYNERCADQVGPIQPNLKYVSNYEIQTQQNFHYPSNANNATNMNSTYFNPLSNNIDEEESSLIALMKMREHDEHVIESFLIENEHEFIKAKKSDNDSASRISETKSALVSVYKLNEELDNMSKELKESRDIPEADWCAKIEGIKIKRFEIFEALGNLRDDKMISKIKTSIEKRKKKRLREKKHRASEKMNKLAAKERRIHLHAKADAWIKDKQDVIEKEKQEVSMRKDADMVLAEVRGRRNDARKFLTLLQELKNLRRIRVNIARARGDHLSSAADEAFASIIDKLVEQWTAMDREYSMEEQGLKLMLKTDNEQKKEKQKRNIFDDWENVLFGRKIPTVDLYQQNVNAFVAIRSAWDKYISCGGLGSRIPIGWVMPEPPSSAAWQQYLKKE